MTNTRTLTIDVWSDIVCPFCYLGDTVLEQALAEFEHRDQVEIRYHSYELMPELGDEPVNLNELLASRYSPEQMQMQNEHLASRGRELGLEYNFDRAITVNTRTAHRLLKFAEEQGKGHELVRILFKAYFTDGKHIGDTDTLVALGEAAGLDGEAARRVLESNDYADAVIEDISMARRLGLQGVPFFVLDSKYGISGAQHKEAFAQALQTAWADASA